MRRAGHSEGHRAGRCCPPRSAAARPPHPAPDRGSTAPDFCFEDGTRLGHLLRHGRGVLLDFGTDDTLRSAARSHQDQIVYRSGPARNAFGFTAVLVRPDGVVAWTAAQDRDPSSFEQAATHWFTPAQH